MKLSPSALRAAFLGLGIFARILSRRPLGRPASDLGSGDVVDVSGLSGRLRQAAFGGARALKRRWRSPFHGHDAGSVTMIRVFFSIMVAANLTICSRSVSNWARRHGERFGQAARSFHQIQ